MKIPCNSTILKVFLENKVTIKRIIAKYRPNPEDIEELAQEVFLKGFAEELDNEIHQPKHLLFHIAKNVAINAAQKKSIVKMDCIGDSDMSSVYKDWEQVSHDDAIFSQQKLFVFSQALGKLSPELKRALVLRKIEGLKYKQIARQLNVSVSTVEKRVALAMHNCLSYIREKGFDPTDFGDGVYSEQQNAKNNVVSMATYSKRLSIAKHSKRFGNSNLEICESPMFNQIEKWAFTNRSG